MNSQTHKVRLLAAVREGRWTPAEEEEQMLFSKYSVDEKSAQELFHHLDSYLVNLLARVGDIRKASRALAGEPVFEIEVDLDAKPDEHYAAHHDALHAAFDRYGFSPRDRERLWRCAAWSLSSDLEALRTSAVWV